MKRHGYTLIEELVAMGLTVITVLIAVQVGRAWWQVAESERFFREFQQQWAALMQRNEEEQVAVTFYWVADRRSFGFRVNREDYARYLKVPATLTFLDLGEPISRGAGQPFTMIRTYRFRRADGLIVRFTTQLGRGLMIRKKN
ncbi:hypothetical protein ACFQ5J_01145 [Lacticaseibacillus baoqingensis]|uniref:Prepilin-type N-terminal cleavage/methylation domain-containing protein n=1 Tax=Lacticaseibacillus baoqingensis TaxID=2486013 RepID=A0ABW4E2Q9_9LACO|nr:hypothetical protein [Lacticaseibacillus baoqingensis]